MDLDVRRDADEKKFSVRIGNDEALLTWMDLTDGLIAFTHTAVPPALRGQGVGEELVRQGLDDAVRRGLRFVPLCPFVQAWLKRHPHYSASVVGLDELELEEESEEEA